LVDIHLLTPEGNKTWSLQKHLLVYDHIFCGSMITFKEPDQEAVVIGINKRSK